MTVYLLNTKVESFLTPMYFYINVYKNRLCMHWSHFWLYFSIINYFANFRRSRVNGVLYENPTIIPCGTSKNVVSQNPG